MEVGIALEETLRDVSHAVRIAGSLRRRKPEVNDIEILLVPKWETLPDPDDMFPEPKELTTLKINELIKAGILEKRKKINGTTTFGPRTKLLIHTQTGIPVDIFSCEKTSWINCLFSRTGGKNCNIAVAAGAKRRGLAWEPFSEGFRTKLGEALIVHSEEEIFSLAGLPYLPPHERA